MWLQNTRLMYWPMLASGDYDATDSFFNHITAMLPFCEFKVATKYKLTGGIMAGECVPITQRQVAGAEPLRCWVLFSQQPSAFVPITRLLSFPLPRRDDVSVGRVGVDRLRWVRAHCG